MIKFSKVIGTFVIGCCLVGSIANQAFAAERIDSIQYTKDKYTKAFQAADKHIAIYTYCKGGPNQKVDVQELKGQKWITIKRASGRVLCSKSKVKETYGGVNVKKGQKYRLHFVNPSKSTITMKIKFIDGDVA